MKHIVLLLVGLIGFASCKKENEPEPVASARVSGTYEVTRLAYDGPGTTSDYDITLPRSASNITASGTLVANKFNNRDDAVTIVVTIKATGQQDQTIDLADFELKPNGSSLDIMYNNAKYGTADGTNLNLDFTENNERFIVVSKRR